MFPFIKEHGKEILNNSQKNNHCHIINDDSKRKLVCKVIEKIHKIPSVDPELTFWQVSIAEGMRIICGIDGGDGTNIYFYPLFIDNHHCIYEDDRFRNDYSKICKYKFANAKCARY